MAAPATEHVRNIVLVGQDGAGKVLWQKQCCMYQAKRLVWEQRTMENRIQITTMKKSVVRFTLGTSIAPIPYKDYKINVLDTSGQPDFLGDTLATMQAAEMAMFVIDAVKDRRS